MQTGVHQSGAGQLGLTSVDRLFLSHNAAVIALGEAESGVAQSTVP
jgi:hypothetical protein